MSDAIERYQAMLAQNPANGLARFSLAKALFDAGRLEEAGAEFRIALKAKPEFMLAQILLGKCELGLGRKDSAKAAFERGLQLAIEQHHDGPQAELEQLLADLEQG